MTRTVYLLAFMWTAASPPTSSFASQIWSQSLDHSSVSSDPALAKTPEASELEPLSGDESLNETGDPSFLTALESQTRPSAFFLSFGTTHPWQQFGLGVVRREVFPKTSVYSRLARGRFFFVSFDEGQPFNLLLSSFALSLGALYQPFADRESFPSFLRALYVDLGLSLDHWVGHLQFLTAKHQSYRVTGLSGFSRLGFVGFFQNGFYLDFCLTGLGVSAPLHFHEGRGAKRTLTSEFSRPTAWGLVNFAFGWQF